MSGSGAWKVTALAPRDAVTAALLAHEDAEEWDSAIVLGGSEVAADRPDEWRLEAWLPRSPSPEDLATIAALFGPDRPALTSQELPATDWVTLSQEGLGPIVEGPFRVRTPDHPPLGEPGTHEFVIPASCAFGTGHHATTAGCLAMLAAIKVRGIAVRNVADVGTGTGLLAFAALALWPRALATASDIDPVCARVVLANAEANGVSIGHRRGELTPVIAPGLDHPVLEARAPYDLIVANILAGPLVELMPDFAAALLPRGHLVLAGLLSGQEPAVRRSARRQGLRLAARIERGGWSILWLRRRARVQ